MSREHESTRLVYFNGLDPETGDYLLPPATVSDVAASVRRRTFGPLGAAKGEPFPTVDPKDLATSGWGLICARGADEGFLEALGPLLERRQEQANRTDERLYQVFSGDRGFLPRDIKRTWLKRRGVGPGPARPEKVPYYLLIVGGPEEVPFDFQFELSLQYAVGRLHFDTLDEYASYAQSVVEAEESIVKPQRLALFGVRNPDDPATRYSTEDLVEPLISHLRGGVEDWDVESYVGEGATKRQLQRLLGGDQTPALVFTASHGLGFDRRSAEPPGVTGALVCQDWPGPKADQKLSTDHYFGAEDIADNPDLQGTIAFHFACYSGGVPRFDSYAHEKSGSPAEIAPRPYLARLPRRLLGHPGGGALAVIGHIDRARGFSYVWPGAGSQPYTIEATLRRLMDGVPVGTAARYLSERCADLIGELNAENERTRVGDPSDAETMVDLWTAYTDARGYMVFGDPAARIASAAHP